MRVIGQQARGGLRRLDFPAMDGSGSESRQVTNRIGRRTFKGGRWQVRVRQNLRGCVVVTGTLQQRTDEDDCSL
jgi:hypothetical protein